MYKLQILQISSPSALTKVLTYSRVSIVLELVVTNTLYSSGVSVVVVLHCVLQCNDPNLVMID